MGYIEKVGRPDGVMVRRASNKYGRCGVTTVMLDVVHD